MGLLETRALDFKNIIMLSVNEGTLPAGRSSNSLILHEVKKYFNLPTYQEKDTVYGYHFFRLLQRAEQIYLIYDNDSIFGQISTVTLTITDSWGCSATDSIEILVGNEILSGDLHPINHVSLCPGIEREINYSPAPLEAHYTWNIDGPTTENNQYYVTETGDYSVLVVTNCLLP